MEDGCASGGVAELLVELQRLLEPHPRQPVLALQEREHARAGEHLRVRGGGHAGGVCGCLLEPASALVVETMAEPEGPEQSRQAAALLRVRGQQAPQRLTKVVVLQRERVRPGPLAWSPPASVGVGEPEEPARVDVPDRRLLAAVGQAAGGVAGNGCRQHVAGGPGALEGVYHGLLDQRGDQIENVLGSQRIGPGNRLGGLEREAAGECRQPAEEDPLVLGQQAVTPVQCRFQRPLARRGRP